MKKDCGTPLRDIRGCGSRSLSQRLLGIQRGYSTINHKSLSFIDTLKCFRLANSGGHFPSEDRTGRTELVKTLETVEVSTDHPRDEYIAVSYPWRPSEGEDKTKGDYYLKSSNRTVKLRNIL